MMVMMMMMMIASKNLSGDTVEQTELKHAPRELLFATQKTSDTSTHSSQVEGSHPETHLSINMGGQSLLLYDLNDPDNPLELAFQQRYGTIVAHEWFGDGFVMLGFSEGFLVVISTHISEIGEELFSGRFHHKSLFDIAYSPTLKYAAVAGDTGIKLVEMNIFKDLKREAIAADATSGPVDRVEWSPDGHILTASTRKGAVTAYLARMPIVHNSNGPTVAYLSSLREISVIDTSSSSSSSSSSSRNSSSSSSSSNQQPAVFGVALEPSFVAVGAFHVAVGMNNVAMYYRYAQHPQGGGGPPLLLESAIKENEQEYLGKVDDICLNQRYTAVLSGGRVTLHEISAGATSHSSSQPPPPSSNKSGSSQQRKTFPQRTDVEATAVALTATFLIYGTSAGAVEFFLVDPNEWSVLEGAELRNHGGAIRMLRPNAAGTRVVVVDSSHLGYVYNPVSAELTSIPSFPAPSVGLSLTVMWDTVDKHVLLVSDGTELHTYCYAPCTVRGPTVSKLGPVEISEDGEVRMMPKATPIQAGLYPISATEGSITCQVGSGSITTIRCPQYEHRESATASPQLVFCQSLALLRLKDAWEAAVLLANRAYWFALSGKAMEVLDIDMAVRVYRQLGDAGMVMGLEQIAHHEDKNLLAGHILLLFSQYSAAQDLFLSSSRPVTALEMRRDLLHWDQALKLAHTLDAQQEPHISVEYAQQLEFRGDNEAALSMFEAAMKTFARPQQQQQQHHHHHQSAMMSRGGDQKDDGGGGDDDDDREARLSAEAMYKVCLAGVARCTLRLGDLRRGIACVKDADDKVLCRDCASILESMSQHSEAASLYEMADQFEKAAAIYIRKLNFAQAAAIMHKVALPKLHGQYARACEQSGKYVEAAEAYEQAHDMDAVVRLYLGPQLNQPDRAFKIVRQTASSEGAQLVARFCQQHGDFRGAIEFLLMAQRSDEAFDLAKVQKQMEVYTSVLGQGIAPDEALRVAQYHEQVARDPGRAGRFYALCGQYSKALKLFIQCGEKEVGQAIEIVGKARSDALTHTLIDFLMGEPDGNPKDPNHIYRLYVALGNYPQAAKTAVIIARQEQDRGKYKQAHAILYETILQLEAHGVHVPQNLRRPFILLHSYMLVRKMIKRNDHVSAARMLLRVAKNISKFPLHAVQLLTSTVIECQRASLKASAHEYATVLMRPEYRSDIEKKFKRKIEAMIRRPAGIDDEEPEPRSPCPISGQEIPETDLECPTTKEEIPMCVVSGKHMEKDDWCLCPNSKLPALYSEYLKFIKADEVQDDGSKAAALDPVCSKPISADDLKLSTPDEVKAQLEAWTK